MKTKKTLIIGASTDNTRYAYKAAERLISFGHSIVNVGNKTGEVAGVPIEPAKEIHDDIDTITLYIGPQHQRLLYSYILRTNPKRLIFNPGAENKELEKLAADKGILTESACTLVLLATGQY